MYVSNRIDSVMGKKKDQTNRVLFFSIFPFFSISSFHSYFFFFKETGNGVSGVLFFASALVLFVLFVFLFLRKMIL